MHKQVISIHEQNIGKVCIKYERIERLYKHKISQMEKVMPLFEYEPFVMSPKLNTLDEEEERGDTDGVGPSGTKVT